MHSEEPDRSSQSINGRLKVQTVTYDEVLPIFVGPQVCRRRIGSLPGPWINVIRSNISPSNLVTDAGLAHPDHIQTGERTHFASVGILEEFDALVDKGVYEYLVCSIGVDGVSDADRPRSSPVLLIVGMGE